MAKWWRPGGVYEFWGYDHYSLVHRNAFGALDPQLKIVNLYVGWSRRRLWRRWNDHEFGSTFFGTEPKEWFDLVIDKREVLWRKKILESTGKRKEYLRIKSQLPQYNVKHNLTNTKRIPPGKDHKLWRAQRAERDRLGGTAHLVELAKSNDVEARVRVLPDGFVERSWPKSGQPSVREPMSEGAVLLGPPVELPEIPTRRWWQW